MKAYKGGKGLGGRGREKRVRERERLKKGGRERRKGGVVEFSCLAFLRLNVFGRKSFDRIKKDFLKKTLEGL